MCDRSRIEDDENDYICGLMTAAFARAYPGVEDNAVEHMARNFAQVVGGVIDVGRRLGAGSDGDLTHMDQANCMVYWCIANTHLEDYFEGGGTSPAEGPIPKAEVDRLMREFAARIADWLAGVEALRDEPELYEAFLRGSVFMGTSEWERDRSKLRF